MEENKLIKFEGGALQKARSAIAITNKLLLIGNDAKVLFKKALFKYGLQDYEGAIEDFNKALKVIPYPADMQKYVVQVKIFLEKTKEMKKISISDYVDFDFARKNNNTAQIYELEKKYSMEGISRQISELLNDICSIAELLDVFQVCYVYGYNPIRVKDYYGLVDYLGPAAKPIMEEIEIYEDYIDRKLEIEEKGELISEILRERTQKNAPYILPEMDKFYYSSDEALINYVNLMTIKIAVYKMKNNLFERGEIPSSKEDEVCKAIRLFFITKIK